MHVRFEVSVTRNRLKFKLLIYFVDLDACTILLEKHRGVLYRTNVMHLQTLDLAFESAIQKEKWDDALAYGIELVPGFRLVSVFDFCSNSRSTVISFKFLLAAD